MVKIILASLITAGSLIFAVDAKAEITLCRPLSTTTRVLNSAAQNDIHPS